MPCNRMQINSRAFPKLRSHTHIHIPLPTHKHTHPQMRGVEYCHNHSVDTTRVRSETLWIITVASPKIPLLASISLKPWNASSSSAGPRISPALILAQIPESKLHSQVILARDIPGVTRARCIAHETTSHPRNYGMS